MKSKPTVVSIVGARPQFVKLAPLSRALAGQCRHLIVHTGQHYDDNMSQSFFRQLKLPRPQVNLSISGGHHGAMTARMLRAIEQLFIANRPDFVIVYGDTNSTLAGALAAAKLSIPVGHVEAGMRSFVDDMPEEINRRLTDHISRLLFCPTETSIENLRTEGIKHSLVHSGDLMYELLHDSKALIKANQRVLRRFNLTTGKYLLVTAHRAANVDTVESLEQLVDIFRVANLPALFPVHPRTRKQLKRYRLWNRLAKLEHVTLCEPLGYLDTLTAAAHARAVLTDSGGLQKEALFLGTPVLTLREETEWVETVGRGNRLVGLDSQRIRQALKTPQAVQRIPYLIKRRRPSHIIAATINRFLTGR